MTSVRRFELRHDRGVSHVHVGAGLLGDAGAEVRAWSEGRRVFVVSSREVLDLFEARVRRLLSAAAAIEIVEVPDGEAAKTLKVAGEAWETIVARGGKRDSRVVGLGGGSVGDLAGFVGGCFLRGVEVMQLPTTLLAQVDASVGGKTAVDLPAAKNMVGVFHHPRWVLADPTALESLPRGELAAGLVEVVKMAAVLDADVFDRFEDDLERLLEGDLEALTWAVAESVRMKIAVVERDPEEAGLRKYLNFGHTLGHAIESVLGYGVLRHGDAVAHGIRFALLLGEGRGLGVGVSSRLEGILDRMALPGLPEGLDREALIAAMRRDKKSSERGTTWVLATAAGEAELDEGITWGEVGSALSEFLETARN